MKQPLILLAVRVIMALIALGLGIWYLSSSIGGAALTYSSMDTFLSAIGAGDNIGDAAGCFMCGYIGDLFGVIGRATALFWTAIVDHIWVLMAVGFGIYLFVHTFTYLMDATKSTADMSGDKNLNLQSWLDPVWKLGARVLVAGALMGMLGMGGTAALKTVTNVTITPVMFVGAELSMAATGISDATQCAVKLDGTVGTSDDDILNPVLQPFMCVIGNLNTVMLAGAGGGFAMMNYAWMGLGGGAITWVAGLALVIMFLIIGFDLFFQVLSVVFKLIFVIIFLPLFMAAAAFESAWKLASGLFTRALGMVVRAAVQVVSITLKILILYATVSYAADEYFPGPTDGYSAIFPPLMGATTQNPDAKTLSVINVFKTCEAVSITDGTVDGDKFRDCFITQKNAVERQYPGAFDFLGDGFEFLLMMIGLFLIYYYAVSPRVDKILGGDARSDFDIGGQIKTLGKNIWNLPVQATQKITKALGKK